MKHLLSALLPLCLLLSGCGVTGGIQSNYRALEEMRIIRTLGYDQTVDGVKLSASTGVQGESGEALLLSRDGADIPQAMDSMQDYSPEGMLFFSHVEYLIAGREAAAAGLGSLLDFVERDTRMRLDAELYVLRDGTAEDLVMGAGGEKSDVTEILSSVRQDVSLRALSHAATVRETAVALSETGAALVCLLQAAETEDGSENAVCSAVPAGYAILKDGRLCGVLEREDAEAVSLLLGYGGAAYRRIPDGSGGFVTLRFSCADSEITPEKDGTLTLRLSVRAAVAAAEGGDAPPDPETLSETLRRSLEDNLREAMERSKALDADYLALGRVLQRGFQTTGALPEDWLRALDYQIQVEAAIDRSYDIGAPLPMDGGETA